MLATVYLFVKKSALVSFILGIVMLVDIDTRAGWVAPMAVSLLGFAFTAGCVYMAVRKDLSNYKEFRIEVKAELLKLGELRGLTAEVKELRNLIEPPQPSFPVPPTRRRWSER